jgi:hypothetical protein
MLRTIILLLPINNHSCMPERSRHIVLRRTGATGNDNFGPSCLKDKTEHGRLWLNVQAHAYGKSGERLGLPKQFAQPL